MERILLITAVLCMALISCEEQSQLGRTGAKPAAISVLPGYPPG